MSEDHGLGSLGGGNLFMEDDADEEGHDLVDQLLGGDSPAPGPSPMVAEPDSQPTNEATMVCLRGPCIHYWSLTSRFPSGLDRITIAQARQCNCFVGEETRLNDANIYECDQWWPRWLAFVPESARAVLRERLKHWWDRRLKRKGFDFSWKWWKDGHFDRVHTGGGVSDSLRGPAQKVHKPPEPAVSGGAGVTLPEEPTKAEEATE